MQFKWQIDSISLQHDPGCSRVLERLASLLQRVQLGEPAFSATVEPNEPVDQSMPALDKVVPEGPIRLKGNEQDNDPRRKKRTV